MASNPVPSRWAAAWCALLLTGPFPLQLPWLSHAQAQEFEYTVANGAVTVTNYIGSGGNVAVPSVIAGLPVKAIGGITFWGRTNLTAVTVPNSVTNIEDGFMSKGGGLGAFSACGALTNVSLGNGVTYLGIGTFALCPSLERVTIPDNVAIVGDFAFHGCLGLADVTIGRGVTQLGPGLGYAFDGSTNLVRVVIPGNVTSVGNFAFSYSPRLTSVTIEHGVTHIGANAFYVCPSLTNVTLPATVSTLDYAAFAYCGNLAGVFFKGNAPTSVGESLFFASTNVTVYYLPGTTGWGPTFAERPTKLWNPVVLTADGNLGVRQDRFGFNIAGTADIPVVVEAATNLTAPAVASTWEPLQSCTLTNGLIYFADPQWTGYAARFYRVRSP